MTGHFSTSTQRGPFLGREPLRAANEPDAKEIQRKALSEIQNY
jgi:hypothetical protein